MYEVGTMSSLPYSRRSCLTFGPQIKNQPITRTIHERIDGFFTRKEAVSHHAAPTSSGSQQPQLPKGISLSNTLSVIKRRLWRSKCFLPLLLKSTRPTIYRRAIDTVPIYPIILALILHFWPDYSFKTSTVTFLAYETFVHMRIRWNWWYLGPLVDILLLNQTFRFVAGV